MIPQKRTCRTPMIITLALLISLFSCSEKDSLDKSFSDLTDNLIKENFEEAVKYVPPQIIEETGRENWIKNMKKSGNAFFTIKISDAQIDKKGNILTSGDTSCCVFVCLQTIRFEFSDDLPDSNKSAFFNNKKESPNVQSIKWIEENKIIESVSVQLYLAVSYNSGDNWYFLKSPNSETVDLLLNDRKKSDLLLEEAKKLSEQFNSTTYN